MSFGKNGVIYKRLESREAESEEIVAMARRGEDEREGFC